MNYKWIVVFYYESDSNPELIPFEEKADARKLFMELQANWADVYLCRIVDGPKA